MAVENLYFGQHKAKRRLTTFELILIAPFVLALLYMSAGSVVLKEGEAPKAGLAMAQPLSAAVAAPKTEAAASVEQAAPAPQSAPVNPPPASASTEIKPSFVNGPTTTLLERIAPIAMLNMVPVESAPAPAQEAMLPAAPVVPEASAAAAPASAPAAAPTMPPAASSDTRSASALQFEIIDATEVNGLAKDAARVLERAGLPAAKISSIPARAQHRIVILYRDGHEEDAQRLSKLFATPPALVNNTHSRDSSDTSDLRLVLGSKAAHETTLFTPDVLAR